MYSSSVPAIASGRTLASVRSAMIAQPVRMAPSRPGGPLTVPSGIWTKTAPGCDDRPRRGDVLVDAHAAAPDRQQPADAADEPLAPRRGEGRRAAPQDPAARLDRQGVHHDERVHPAPMRAGDEQIAASRDVLLAGGLDAEAEQPEADEPDEQPGGAIQQRRLRLRRAAEPGQAL